MCRKRSTAEEDSVATQSPSVAKQLAKRTRYALLLTMMMMMMALKPCCLPSDKRRTS